MALQAAMQRGSGQVRKRRLQGIEAVIQRQESVAPEGDNDGLLLWAEHGGARHLRSHGGVSREGSLRWSLDFGQAVKLGLPARRTDPDDGQADAVFGGVQGEGCS